MAIEKKWAAVPAQSATSNATSDGEFFVSDACLFKVGQIVILNSDTQDATQYKVNRIPNTTTLLIGQVGRSVNDRADISAYTTADNATISALEQNRPAIAPDDTERASFAEEPIVAKRSVLVDKCGDYFSSNNPLPVGNSFGIPNNDYKGFSYTDTTITITYRQGGSGGTIVGVLVFTYLTSDKCDLASIERTV